MSDEPEQKGLIDYEQAGKLLKLTSNRVRQLVRDRHLPKDVKGKMPLVGVVHGYIDFLRDESRKSAATATLSRVQDARAREIEMRIARDDGQLIELTEHDAIFAEAFGVLRARFASIPARLTRDADLRRAIETEIDDGFRACSQSFAKAAASTGDAVEDTGAAGSDDT